MKNHTQKHRLTDPILNGEPSVGFQAVSVALGSRIATIDIRRVTSIVMPQASITFADLPKGVRGVIALRGRLVPIIDLRGARSGRSADRAHPVVSRERIVVVHADGVIAGLVVDAVTGFVTVSTSNCEDESNYAKLLDVRAILESCCDGGLQALRGVQLSSIDVSRGVSRSLRRRAA